MRVNELGQDIWAVDGPDVVFAGAAMHTRMTVVRLGSGDLWVHSPIQHSDVVGAFVRELAGNVVALVAPNKFHHLYVKEWQRAYPGATVYAEPTVQKKVQILHTAETITNRAPALYSEDIDQLIFAGNRMFQEAVFFHKQSKTLILTDLMINLKTDHLSGPPKWFLQFEQVTFPNGGIPRLYRWLTHDKKKARAAMDTIFAWGPARLTFCHGDAFEEDADTTLRREFGYLLGSKSA